MNSHGNVWYARHLEKGTGQYGCLQMPIVPKKQVFLHMVIHVCNPGAWETEGK